MENEKRTIDIDVAYKVPIDRLNGKLIDTIAYLESIRDSVEKQYWNDTIIYLHSDYENFSVCYQREETEDDVLERVEQEKKDRERIRALKKAEYEKLKAEFGE